MNQEKRRLLAALLVIFAVNVAVILLFQHTWAATYSVGSTGEQVRVIQDKLQRWGYYDGSVDGVYGSATEAAVRYFQRSNGLTEDGVVGAATLKALGMSDSASNGAAALDNSTALLARVISAEARGEPYEGQVAVGAVILNRVEHPSFPATIAGVVFQPGAFSCMDDGQIDEEVTESAIRAAREALNGSDPTGGAIYYFNPGTATSSWIWSRPLLTVIGSHRFCA
ncbi:MAG: spore cortex-lytic enzyme [Oscillospiraceae bacterium]|nr:spore cortex-lytic enzyme [Oscillospiraceae bacterium]